MQHDVIVVGGGVSGLATAYWLERVRPDLDVTVLEAGKTAGGHVTSVVEDGFTVDWGPTALAAAAPDSAALINSLGLDNELVEAAPSSRRRYVVRAGRLVSVPGSPVGLLGSPLLSPVGKLRAALEPFVSRRARSDESVAGLLRRRFGDEVAAAFGAVAVTGLVAGDPERLSAPALFPRLVALERQYGSLLRGFIYQQRAARSAVAVAGRSSRGLATFRGGLGRLTSSLAAALGPALRTSTEAVELLSTGDGVTVALASGDRLTAHTVVLATPAPASAVLLATSAPEAAEDLKSIRYAGVGVATLGYASGSSPSPPDGFGFLAPPGEGVRSLGVQFESSTFPGSAPDGAVLLRAICGGVLDPGFLSLSDAEAIAAVRDDLAVTLGITAHPVFTSYRRVPSAIPQYELGHEERLGRIERALAPIGGLHLVGNAYRGVGVNDCLREARRLATRLAEQLPSRSFAEPNEHRPDGRTGSAAN